MLKMLMQKNGVGSKDYDIVPTGGTPSRYAALKTGAIAATMLSQSVDFLAQSEGFNLLGYSYEAFDAPLVSIAVQRKWATANADTTGPLTLAKFDVDHLPKPDLPGAGQKLPVQEEGTSKRVPPVA